MTYTAADLHLSSTNHRLAAEPAYNFIVDKLLLLACVRVVVWPKFAISAENSAAFDTTAAVLADTVERLLTQIFALHVFRRVGFLTLIQKEYDATLRTLDRSRSCDKWLQAAIFHFLLDYWIDMNGFIF